MSWNNPGTLCFFQYRSIPVKAWLKGQEDERAKRTFGGAMFTHLVADKIVTECSKAHFCLIFLLLVKLK